MNKHMAAPIIFATSLLVAIAKPNPKVPEQVKRSFNLTFPMPEKNVNWEKENHNFKFEFVLNGLKTFGFFDKNGNLVEIDKEINLKDLPEEILLSLGEALDFEKFEVTQIVVSNDMSGGLLYCITFNHKNQRNEAMIFRSIEEKNIIVKRQGVWIAD